MWYDILKACRRVERDGKKIDVFTLSDYAGIKRGVKATPSQQAGAWISKMYKWGYLKYGPTVEGLKTYVLTRWGKEYRPGGGKKK